MEILSIIDLGIQLKGKKEQGRLSSSFHPSQRTDIASNSLITCLPLYNNAQGREQESGAINLPTLLQINSFLHSRVTPTFLLPFVQNVNTTDRHLCLPLPLNIYNCSHRYWNFSLPLHPRDLQTNLAFSSFLRLSPFTPAPHPSSFSTKNTRLQFILARRSSSRVYRGLYRR